MSSGSLEGQRVLITGASGGLGSAIALACAKAGAAELILLGRTKSSLSAVADTATQAGSRPIVRLCDVTDREALASVVDGIDPPDTVVAAAGTNRPGPFVELKESDLEDLIRLNLTATINLFQLAAQAMIASAVKGTLIAVSSQMGHVGAAGRVAYCATKHGVEGMVKAAAVELAPEGIRVVSVAPTFIATSMTEPFFADQEFRSQVIDSIPLGRIGTPEEVAPAVVFLASDSAALITGSSLLIDGGWTAV